MRSSKREFNPFGVALAVAREDRHNRFVLVFLSLIDFKFDQIHCLANARVVSIGTRVSGQIRAAENQSGRNAVGDAHLSCRHRIEFSAAAHTVDKGIDLNVDLFNIGRC